MTAQTTARAQAYADPVVVDPKHYKVEMENEQARVLRITYDPHERSVMHGHPAAVAVCLTDFHARFTSPDGKTEERRGKAGDTIATPPEEHLPENFGAERFELILVEFKR